MITTKEIGDKGELTALNYLADKGYNILECNYRYQKAEVDIIADDGNFIVFVEVKTRAQFRLTEPEDSVNKKKQQLLISAAQYYLEKKDLNKEARFDIVSIIYSEDNYQIKHIEDAFYALG